jgi:hypothetical protein
MGVRVTVGVAVGGSVGVGDKVEVVVACVVDVGEAVSSVVWVEISVCVCLKDGEGAGVAVLSLKFVIKGVGVFVQRAVDGALPVSVEGDNI